jgi:hypothetical protein
MAAKDTGGAKVKPGAKARAKVKAPVTTPTPDQQDRNRQPRTPPPPIKVRAFAHPSRPGPQKVFHDQQVAAQREKEHQQATRRAIRHVKVTPVPSPDARDSTRSPAQQAHDRQVVARTVRESREEAVRKEHRGSGTRFIQHVAAGGLRTNSAATAPPTMGVPTITHKHGGGGAQFAVIRPIGAVKLDRSTAAGRLALNVAPDAAELAVTTPSSVAKLASTAVHQPKKVPGMLAKPYTELYHHPGESFTERPVSSTLLVAPVLRVPGRAAGRVARIAGKQTLERPAASLPGTALKEQRTGSRDVVVRAIQSRRDRKNPLPTMTRAQVERRADEFHDYGQQHTARVVDSAARQAKAKAKTDGLSKQDTAEAVRLKVEGARGGARNQVDERFGREFGATHEITPQGHIVMPKSATEGVLHDTHAAAKRIADRLNGRDATVARGRHTPLQIPRQSVPTPHEFVVHAAGDRFAVVPKAAADRIGWHRRVGTSQAPGSKLLRVAGRTFRTAVLPLSAKWLTGQASEAGIRSAVAGAGPLDLWRFRSVVKRMNAEKPGSGNDLVTRITGGQFGLTGTAREFAEGRSLADEFQGTALEDIAHGLTKAGSTAPARAVRSAWGKYTNVVFNTVNGAIENTARQAMAGQAIRSGPLMEHRIHGLSDRAIQDAAHGLKGTHAQVQLGRAVDRMYGQYQKFSPAKRETLLHTTPFYPWYRNVVTFVTKTLPVDHPVKTALLTDISALEEDWRKSHGMSLRQGGGKPGFLLGGYPVGSGEQVSRVGRYTPFVPGDPLEASADLVTPQFGNVKEILHGHDFAGRDIKGNRILVALDSLAEAHVPGLGQVGRVTGLPGHYVRKTGEPTVLTGKDLLEALRREVDPLMPTRATQPQGSTGSGSTPSRIKVPGTSSGSGRIKVPGVTGRVKIP